MKDRNFSTKKLADSIKALRKASGVNVKEFCKSIHMTDRSYYRALNGKLLCYYHASFGRGLWRLRTGRRDRGGETGMVECGDGELVGVSGGGEEREVVRGRW